MYFHPDIEGCMILRPKKTILQARLTDLSVEDLTENTLYTKVIMCYRRKYMWGVCICVCLCVFLYLYVYMCMFMCVCLCVCVCVHMYV